MKDDKNKVSKIKEWVDITIEFLKLVSEYLGKAVAAILPRRKGHKK